MRGDPPRDRARRPTPASPTLQTNLAAQERAEEHGDAEAFDALDEALHRLLAAAERPRDRLVRSRAARTATSTASAGSACPEPGYLGEMVAEHRELVAAIAAGDADRAEAAMRHHLRMVLSSVPHIQAAHPEYFEES